MPPSQDEESDNGEEWAVASTPRRPRSNSFASNSSGHGGKSFHNGNRARANSLSSNNSWHGHNRQGGGRHGRGRGRGTVRSHSFSGGAHNHQHDHPQQHNQRNHTPNKRPGVRRHKSHDHSHFKLDHNHHQHQHQHSNKTPLKHDKKGGGTTPHKKKAPKRVQEELDVSLLTSTGEGPTPEARKVVRISQEVLFSRRMQYLDRPSGWSVHERCLWKATDRLELIQKEMKTHFDFKPLGVNNETRWKAKVMQDPNEQQQEEEENKAERLRRGTAILNKLSWTNLEKLTVQFLEALGVPGSTTAAAAAASSDRNNEADQNNAATTTTNGDDAEMCEHLLRRSMKLVLEKAMLEPHFAELYAGFSSKLSDAHTGFRQVLLALCQEQFDETHREEEEKEAEPDSKEAALLKKKSIGLMRFIGELYKNQLMKGRIMVSCLQLLFQPDDEEKLECYAQLMTTIGARLHHTGAQQAATSPDAKAAMAELHDLWRQTYSMAGRKCPQKLVVRDYRGPTAPSNRIKFLLQDLIDLRENDWISQLRHRQEKAKTIAEIHQDVAREEEEAARRNNKTAGRRVMRSQSFNNAGSRGMPVARSNSFNSGNTKAKARAITPTRSSSSGGRGRGRGRGQPARRTKSDSLSALQSGLRRTVAGPPSPTRLTGLPSSPDKGQNRSLHRAPSESLIDFKIVEYLEPSECGEKMKAILKEFFVGGDFDDAILSIEELVGMGDEGDVARGAAVIEAGVLLVMEMKPMDVASFRALIERCLDEENLDRQSLARGLNEPIEFLRDIEIDAPRAGDFLADIVAGWVKSEQEDDPLSLSTLLLRHPALPSKPADFAVEILARRGGESSEREVEVVQSLLAKGDVTNEKQKSRSEIMAWIEETRAKI